MRQIDLSDNIDLKSSHQDHEPITPNDNKKGVMGILEFIVKDRKGNIVQRWQEPNIVKIFAKEMLSHRLPSSEVWDPLANSGEGGWVDSGIDPNEEFAARYILLGAAFSSDGQTVENDTRFYIQDASTGSYVPKRLGPGAEFDGTLINAVPLSEPNRPLKRIEAISFQPTYQPAGNPLLQDDVRAMNNIVALQTTIKLDEYNGFGLTESDFFVLTEVALVGGRKIDTIGLCECTPRKLFLQGLSGSDDSNIPATANGSDVISLDSSVTGDDIDVIKEGDQLKIVGSTDTGGATDSVDQVSPYYFVTQKALGGRDIILDRIPVDSNNTPLTGSIGVFRDTLRIYSHRILKTPVKKSSDFEITIIWRIIFN